MIFRRRGKPDKATEPSLEPSPLLGLGILLFLSTLPMFSEMPSSIDGVISLLFMYRLAMLRFPQVQTNRMLLFLLTLAGISLVIAHFHTLFGYQAGMSLFAMMMALKFAETQRNRDFYIIWIIGLFYLVGQFLTNQSMSLALYLLLLVTGLYMVLLRYNRGRPTPPKQLARFVGLTLLQAIPLVVVLFLLFPRLNNPLWNIKLPDSGTGITGLSDHMEPGSINRLIQSKEPVLRAEFSGKQPENSQLYWRGPVLWRTDGKRWYSQPSFDVDRKPEPLRVAEGKLTYRLIVEPHGKKWVLPLDLPATAPALTDMSIDYQIIAHTAINQRRQFNLVSYTRFETGELTAGERSAALDIPANITYRTKELVRQWVEAAMVQRDVVDSALSMFHRDYFVYTLTPPRLDNNPTDSFLFDTKAGFCEHYASSFTLLMRLAGIPSRVVTGYLGGEYNELGNYYIIRQSDAHAWSEVWLEDTGWTRVDPTASVAPERIHNAILFDTEDSLGSPISFRVSDDYLLAWVTRKIRLSLDTLNMNWHIWILNYDNAKQADLLKWLGLYYVERYAANLAMVILCLIFAVVLWLFNRQGYADREDEVTRSYALFCRQLERVGIIRSPFEGPVDFADRASSLRLDLESEIRQITCLFTRIKYQGIDAKVHKRRLQQMVKHFRPVKRASIPKYFEKSK